MIPNDWVDEQDANIQAVFSPDAQPVVLYPQNATSPQGAMPNDWVDELPGQAASAPSAPPASVAQQIKSGAMGFGSGASVGFLDEATAALMTPYMQLSGMVPDNESWLQTYRLNRQAARDALATARAAAPTAYGAGEIGGGITSGIALPFGKVNSLKSAMQTGAAYGAAAGYGFSDAENFAGQGIDAVTGGVMGAGGGALGYGVAKGITSPTTRALFADESGSLFPKAPSAGAGAAPQFSAAERTVMRALMEEKGMTPQQAADAIQQAGKPGPGGVPLSLPEQTGSKTLIKYEKRLVQNPGLAGEIEGQFRGERAGTSIPAAYSQQVTKNIGQITTPEAAAGRLQKTSETVLKSARDKRAAAAQPFYDLAYRQTLDEAQQQALLQNPVIESAFARVQKDPVWQAELAKHPPGSVGAFDLVKRSIDDMIETAKKSGENARARILTQSKNELLTLLDQMSPAYQRAREVFASGSPKINRLEESIIGLMAQAKDDPVKAADALFKSSPTQIRMARRILGTADPTAWNNMVATYMANVAEKANYSPAKILNALSNKGEAGNVIKANRLDAALSPAQRAAKDRLFNDLLKATSIKHGSDTAANLSTDAMMKFDMMSPAEQLADAAMTGPVTKTELMRRAAAWMQDLVMHNRYAELANIFVGQGSDDFAQRLMKAPPNSLESWRIINERIAKTGAAGVAGGTRGIVQPTGGQQQ